MKMTCFSRRVKIEECKSFERFLFSKKKIETVAIKTNRVDIYRVGENINIHDEWKGYWQRRQGPWKGWCQASS